MCLFVSEPLEELSAIMLILNVYTPAIHTCQQIVSCSTSITEIRIPQRWKDLYAFFEKITALCTAAQTVRAKVIIIITSGGIISIRSRRTIYNAINKIECDVCR